MGIRKYKYYFKKPKSQITKDILKFLLFTGAFAVAASSEKFWWDFWMKAFGLKKSYRPKRKVYDAFRYLLKNGFINVEERGKQIYISLTEKGKAKAGWLQINDFKIKKPKKWDGKWRIVVFDISQLKKMHREAFRGKLKELGFYPLQKSVWIYPFDCQPEIELLREFFGLTEDEIRLIVAETIGNDTFFRKIFFKSGK